MSYKTLNPASILIVQDTVYNLMSNSTPYKKIIDKINDDFGIIITKPEIRELLQDKAFNEFDMMLSTKNLLY